MLFVPTGSKFGVIGAPCGGPALGAFLTSSLLELHVSNIPSGQYALIVIGTQKLKLQLPAPGCFLYTDVLVSVGVAVSPTGEAVLRVLLPKPAPTGTFRTEFFISSGGGWRASNALSTTF